MKNYLCVSVFIGGFLLFALAGCAAGPPQAGPKEERAGSASGRVTFVLSGETDGFIVPCGCTFKQFGGLPRRGTCLQLFRQAEGAGPGSAGVPPASASAGETPALPGAGSVVYVDAGGNVHRATAYDAIKLEYILRGLAKMQVAAVNLGPGEILLGAEKLRELAQLGAPLLSTNVTAGEAQPWKDHISLTAGGLKLALVGVCAQAVKAGPGLVVNDPEQALRESVPGLAQQHDAVILLVYGSEDACAKLCSGFPEITTVLATGVPQPVAPRLLNERIVFAAAAQKGKFLARAELACLSGKWELASGNIVELDEGFADQKEQMQNLADYKARLRQARLEPAATGEAPALLASVPREYRYAGSQTCAECHPEDNEKHKASQHATAVEKLRERNFEYDPYCLKCHTTGYGGPGGFVRVDLTPALSGVGCENCHGPSLGHLEDPHVRTPSNAKSACPNCHDAENSPKFEYTAYYKKVEHGQVKATRWKRAPVVKKEGPASGTN
ncbi:MAG: cytochrome c family protein [Planctomycetota bacterium]